MQLAVVIIDRHLLRIVTELPQPVEVIGFEEGEAGEPLVLVILQAQMLHRINLFADSIGVDTQQIVAAAAEFSRDVHVIIMMEHRLLHMQLIGVGIQQRLQTRESELSHGAQ